MARVKGAMMTRKRRNKTLKPRQGLLGFQIKHFKMAQQAVFKSLTYAYTGRRLKKRGFPQTVDHPYQRCLQAEWNELFHLYEWAEKSWH